jgi:hypothetical protein
MLADIDTDDGDADAAAAYMAERYLDGHAFAEPSTGGRGRHDYFKVDVTYCSRAQVWDRLRDYAEVVKADGRFASLGCRLDKVFYGLPTCWERVDGRWEVERRGTCVKLPYLGGERAELDALEALPALSFRGLDAYLASRPARVVAVPASATAAVPTLSLDTRLGAQVSEVRLEPKSTARVNRAREMLEGADVIRSRWGAYLVANQSLGRKATPEEACAVYEQQGAATGERTYERIRFFERIESLIAAPDGRRSDPYRFTDTDVTAMADWLAGRIGELLVQANRKLRAMRRGTLALEDVARMAVWQRKAILANDGYCGHKMIHGFVAARRKTHPTQKVYNAHHVNEAFEILEALGFSRKIADDAYNRDDPSKSLCRRYRLCCAPNLVSHRPVGVQ